MKTIKQKVMKFVKFCPSERSVVFIILIFAKMLKIELKTAKNIVNIMKNNRLVIRTLKIF